MKMDRAKEEDIATRNTAPQHSPSMVCCVLLTSLSFPETAIQSLVRFQFQLWFHVESGLSEASGLNASEVEQTLETARTAEAVIHYRTRFWQGKVRRPAIRAALVTWQLDLRPWGRTPEFRADCVSLELLAIKSHWNLRWKRQHQVSCSLTRGQRKTTLFPEISSPVLLKARQHPEGP